MKKKANVAVLLSLALIIIAALVLFIPFKRSIVFDYQDTDKVLGFMPVGSTDRFTIRYTHSVHRTPVTEYYKIKDDGDIEQVKLKYERTAIGMPSNASGDEVFKHIGDHYIITNMHRVFPYIDLRVGQVISNHTLIFKNKKYRIADFTGPGEWTRIRVENISLWNMLKGERISDKNTRS